MRFVDRFEYKYVLDYSTYLAFKNKLLGFMKQGNYTEKASNKRYFVRSLYYDTFDYRHFMESEDGNFGRIKCRVRSYSRTITDTDVISIEIKTKHGVSVKKYSELISLNEYQDFLKNKMFTRRSVVLDEFTRLLYNYALEPKLIIEYDREGYIPKDGSDLRLTFDHQVKSSVSKKLFNEDDLSLRSHSNSVVCEIKCGMKKPDWLESLIKAYGLKVVRNSKYVQAVHRIYPAMIRQEPFFSVQDEIRSAKI
jgi:hypothetical protein